MNGKLPKLFNKFYIIVKYFFVTGLYFNYLKNTTRNKPAIKPFFNYC